MSTKTLDDTVEIHAMAGRRVIHDIGISGIVMAVATDGDLIVLFDEGYVRTRKCHPKSVRPKNA